MYFKGEGVDQDSVEALRWYLKAAFGGDGTAQTILGTMYVEGNIVYQDYDEALKWYSKAAKQGDVSAHPANSTSLDSDLGGTIEKKASPCSLVARAR